jgi:hypothetical protein
MTLASDVDDEGRLEKSLLDIRTARQSIEKSEGASPALLEKTQRVERDLELEYLRKHSAAYSPEREEIRKRNIEAEGGGVHSLA